jgi:hypothetical protein
MGNDYSRIDKQIAEGRGRDALHDRAIYDHDVRGDLPILYRFVVLETIFDPTIVDQNKIAYYQHALGISNIQYANALPRNTIIAKRVLDSFTPAASPPMFLFPLLPASLSLPCKPGEHVWVMFENQTNLKNDLGYWLCKIVSPGFVEDVNHTHAPREFDSGFVPSTKDTFDGTAGSKYEFRNGKAEISDGERYTVAETATLAGAENEYEKLITETEAAAISVYESVPRFKKRPADTALEGSNNTLIVLGRDRTGAAAEYVVDNVSGAKRTLGLPLQDDQLPGSGAIDIVAGRGQVPKTAGNNVKNSLDRDELGKTRDKVVESEGDPDFKNDRSRIYVSQRTKVDSNFDLSALNASLNTGKFQGTSKGGAERSAVSDSASGDGAIVIKTDKIRLIARSDVEIVVKGYIQRDENGRIIDSDDLDEHAVIAMKSNGDIVFKPSKKGYIKLGADDADKGIVCSDVPVVAADGNITGPPLTTTMGGFFAGSKKNGESDNGTALSSGQGKFANRVLVK